MAIRPELHQHEEVLLLSLHDEKGTVQSATTDLAMGGAILAELLMGERFAIDESGRRGMLVVRDSRQTGNRILDECLERVRTAKRRATPATWVGRFAGLKRLRQRVAEGLVHRGILRSEEGKVLLLFNRTTYPTINPRPERAVVDRLRRGIFSDDKVDANTAVLISIANSTGLLAPVFGRKEMKERKDRLKAIAASDAGRATRHAVDAAQAAVIAAVTAATVAATAAASAG